MLKKLISKKSWAEVTIFLSLLLLVLFTFNTIFLNPTKVIYDWFDYPYIIWTIYQSASHFGSLNFNGIFDTNAFYPYKGTLLFSDTLLIWGLIAAILDPIFKNPILVFNIIFLLNFVLVIWGSIFFWKKLFKNHLIIFFVSLTTILSPFVVSQIGHFQLMNIWPLLFGLGFLIAGNLSKKSGFILGLMMAFQFYQSVYLGIMLLFMSGLWFLIYILPLKGILKRCQQIFPSAAIAFLTLVIFFGPLALKYIQVKKAYGINREYSEYVQYSAHITDYFFTTHFNSFISDFGVVRAWNSLNHHFLGESATFPGLVLVSLFLLGVVSYKTFGLKEKKISLEFNYSKENLFFILILILGLLFSLGPRLNANGKYLEIPILPYNLLVHFPLFEPIRAPARWSLLLFLGLSYFAGKGLLKISSRYRKEKLIILVVSASFFLEVAPIYKLSEAKDYYPSIYRQIEEKCLDRPKVLIEYPLDQQQKEANILTNLTYKTQLQLASIKHKCLIVNGYSGFNPLDYQRFESQLDNAIAQGEKEVFLDLLKEKEVELVKINKAGLNSQNLGVITNWINKSDNFMILREEGDSILLELKANVINS